MSATSASSDAGHALLDEAQKPQPDLEKMRALIDAGASLEYADDKLQTPLLAAASKNRSEAARLLVECGANIRAVNKDGITPLIYAAINGDALLTKELLAHGIDDPDGHRYRGRTALMWAAQLYKREVAYALAEAGADPELKSRSDPPSQFERNACECFEEDGKEICARKLREIAKQFREDTKFRAQANERFKALLDAGMPTQKNVAPMRPLLKRTRKNDRAP